MNGWNCQLCLKIPNLPWTLSLAWRQPNHGMSMYRFWIPWNLNSQQIFRLLRRRRFEKHPNLVLRHPSNGTSLLGPAKSSGVCPPIKGWKIDGGEGENLKQMLRQKRRTKKAPPNWYLAKWFIKTLASWPTCKKFRSSSLHTTTTTMTMSKGDQHQEEPGIQMDDHEDNNREKDDRFACG